MSETEVTRGGKPVPRRSRRLRVRLMFELRDIWVGVFWKVTTTRASDLSDGWGWRVTHVYVCLVPCLPILVTYSAMRPWAIDAVGVADVR